MRAFPALAGAGGEPWSPGLESQGWDRSRELLDGEAAAIAAIGPVGLRRNRATGIPRRTARHWNAISRLVIPLDAARAALHHDDDPKFRRAGAQAAAVILQHCADTGQSYWAWSSWDWARLAGPGSGEFLAARALPTERTVRPFLVALAYLLGGFTGFQHLGMFNRLHLAQLVFGGDAVDAAMNEAAAVLDRWGYRSQTRDGEYRLPGVLAQALLINGSPRLSGLTTEAFARLHEHPAAAERKHTAALFALQKVAADLGYRAPPVRPGGNHMAVIEGTAPAWAQWVERWHATIAGAGLDGELAEADVWHRCTDLASQQLKLRESDVEPYLSALSQHPSEATTLLAANALGIKGKAEIRDRAALVTVDDRSPVAHIINARAVTKINDIARQLIGTSSLDEAENVVAAIRGKTELAHERRKASTIDRSEPAPGQAELAKRYAAYRERSIDRGATLLTFRRLGEVIGLHEYRPGLIRSITGADAHPRLALCLL